MISTRFISEDHPAFVPEVLPTTLRTLHRGEAMGFLADQDRGIRLGTEELSLFLEALWEERVAQQDIARLVAALEAAGRPLGTPADPEEIRAALEGIYLALRENPVPRREWGALLRYFGAEQLATLLRVSQSSVQRYARGMRTTPLEVAARLHWLAIVVGYLSASYNEFGVRRWFERARKALGGHSPQARLLAEDDWSPRCNAAQEIEALARAGTGMGAT